MPADYRVELEVYNGPLDLLLYLIKRDELDIYDIPIARITDSYISYVNMLRQFKEGEGLDIDVAGDFMVMAATLMEIKSAMLLPRAPAGDNAGEPTAAQELADPRYELVQQLLEYKAFKDRANLLAARQELHQQRFPRVPAKLEASDEPPPLDLDEVQIWDLLSAFQRLMAEVGQRKPRYHEVIYDDTPIDLHAADIEDRLRRERRLSLRQLIEGRQSRSEMIGVFLALLELVRERKVIVHAGDAPNEIVIETAPPEHRRPAPPIHLAEQSQQEESGSVPQSPAAADEQSGQ